MKDFISVKQAAEVTGYDSASLHKQLEADLNNNRQSIPCVRCGNHILVVLRTFAQMILGIEYNVPEKLANWLIKWHLATDEEIDEILKEAS